MTQSDLPSWFDERKRSYGLDRVDRNELQSLVHVIMPHIPMALDQWVEAGRRLSHAEASFVANGAILKKVELEHIEVVFEGSFDQVYLSSCKELAARETQLGIDPRARVFLANKVTQASIRALSKCYRFSPATKEIAINLLLQVIFFDIGTVLTHNLQAQEQIRETRRQNIDDAIDVMARTIGAVIKEIALAAQSLRDTSTAMESVARETVARMSKAADAYVETNERVRASVAATEALSSSISEIGQHATHSLDTVGLAISAADKADVSIHTLKDASLHIGSAITLIAKIASQTNLLALNAAIEAARAGAQAAGSPLWRLK